MLQTEKLEQMKYAKLVQQGINLTIQTLLVKRYLVIRTEALEHWEYVKLAQQGINLRMIQTLLVKRFLVQIRTEELEH